MSFLGWYYDDAPRASSSPFAQTDCQIQEGIQEGQTWICTNVGPYLLIQMDFNLKLASFQFSGQTVELCAPTTLDERIDAIIKQENILAFSFVRHPFER